jgi:UDP-glucose 4-epimerase
MVVPTFVRQALAAEPITVFGDGTQSRSFTFVADVVGALLTLMTEPRAIGEVFNIGNPEEVSISGLAERIKAETASASPIVRIPYDQAYEAGFEDMPRRVPDLRKIHDLIGYLPKVGLADIIKAVVADQRTRVNVHSF